MSLVCKHQLRILARASVQPNQLLRELGLKYIIYLYVHANSTFSNLVFKILAGVGSLAEKKIIMRGSRKVCQSGATQLLLFVIFFLSFFLR